ncbi:serine O-acetyltransferase [Alteromonas sp. CYL-A6]|uniref:serine O-acetyltransferase n=1 Tax=Alteromonas nitratireducens TaxID=3390813 RepID=UPI0034B88A0B
MIKQDFARKREIFEEDGASVGTLRLMLSDGTSANVIYRMVRWCARYRLIPLCYALQYLNKLLNSCVIGYGAQFGSGFVIMHPVGIVINSKVRGGNNITLESGVVIGDEKGQSPVLGNNVFVGAGAKIIGPVKIGNNVKIGANAVVTKDAPDNATMLGIPAKPLVKKQESQA